MAAGEYRQRLVWLKRTTSKGTTGQDEETFTDNGRLWCAVSDGSGRQYRAYGSEQSGSDFTVRVRNFPALSALDRLQAYGSGELYVIESIGRGENELVCTCQHFDDLNLEDE